MTHKTVKDAGRKGRARKAESPRGGAVAAAVEKRGVWIALGSIIVLLVVFFNPVFFGGKGFQPPDQLASLAHQTYLKEAFASSGTLLDRYPLWTPYIFSGMPSFGSLIAAPYTNPMSFALAPIPITFKMVTYYVLLGIITWAFLRRKGLDVATSLFGAVSYIFCAHVITMIVFAHNSKIATLVYLPAVLMATDAVWERPGFRRVLLLGLAVGTMLVSSHLQISYYTLLAAGLFLVAATAAAFRGGPGWAGVAKRWGAWGTGLALGLAASAVLSLPVREYAAHSIRGGGGGGGLEYAYATNWSFHPLEMITFFVPSFAGFGGETYWGWMPFTDFPHYMGILPLFLAVLTVVLWPRERLHAYFAALGLFALVLAFGKHVPILYNLLFEFFPYFNKFRVPSMILVLFQFAVAMLAALGLWRIVNAKGDERARIRKPFWILAAAFAAIVVVFGGWAASGGLDTTVVRRLGERAEGYGLLPEQMASFAPRVAKMVRADLIAVLGILALGLALLRAGLRERVPARLVPVGILLLTLVDLWRVDFKPGTYYPREVNRAAFEPTQGVRFLQQDPERFRILPFTGQGTNNNQFAYYKIPSILGYHPAKLQIYQDLIDDQGSVGILKTVAYGNMNVVSMLNMKYMVADQAGAQRYLEVFQALVERGALELVHRSDLVVFRNRAVLPHLWFVDRARVIEDEAAHLEALADPAWRPAEEALVFSDPGPLDPGSGGSAAITRYEPREIEATVSSPGSCLLVLSEVFYEPGWNAWIDGAPVPVHRVNYVLRGIRVPPGEHTLRMRFDPPVFRTSAFLTLGAYGLIFAGLAASFGAGWRRKRRATEPPVAGSAN